MLSEQTLLRHIDHYLNMIPCASCDVETVGSFTLFFRRNSTMPEITYARPTAPLGSDSLAEIALVRKAFKERERVCRWEFIADLFPDFAARLVQAGFPEPISRPLMVVTRETFRPEIREVAEIRPITRTETRLISRVLGAAFGEKDLEPEAPDEDDSDMLGKMMERGCSIFGAFVEGQMVAGGSHSPIADTTEIAGVGTLRNYRRRGIAGALTSALVADALSQGCETIFLSAADDTVQRVYTRIGFERIGVAMDTMETPLDGELLT
jgi:ribosomal protein S18 acetylase RimI-like enzyme